jgi:hypothetical protein
MKNIISEMPEIFNRYAVGEGVVNDSATIIYPLRGYQNTRISIINRYVVIEGVVNDSATIIYPLRGYQNTRISIINRVAVKLL